MPPSQRASFLHQHLTHSFYFSTLLISLTELFTPGCQITSQSCFSSFSFQRSITVPVASLLLSSLHNTGAPQGICQPSLLWALTLLYNLIYVQRLSKVSTSRSDLSSELRLKFNRQFDSSTRRSDILRCPKSMSPFSLHKPIFNLLSLTPHQLHYFSFSGQNLRVMFVWMFCFFFRVVFNSCSSPASHPIY